MRLPFVLAALLFTANAQPAPSPSFAEPSLSPDGREIAFASGGDIWTVPAQGGEARLLVSHPATESRPVYSPDGRRVAFISTRTGNGDIYVLDFASGDVSRITWDDANDQLDGWSRDGRWLFFSSTSRDVAGMNDIYRVSAAGGTPMRVAADRYTNEFFASPAPGDSVLAITARGISSAQWWRLGSSHIDQSEIWLVRPASGSAAPRYQQVTQGGARELWPAWSPDGRTLFYASDRGGAQNLWAHPLGGTPRQLTRFRDGRVLWPSISADGRTLVFERDFRVWSLDVASGRAAEVPIVRRGTPAGPAAERLVLNDQIQDLALSPDGKKLAFIVRGEVFSAASKEGGDAQRVTSTPQVESQVTWAPDSRRLAYVSLRDGASSIHLYDFGTRAETRLTRSDAGDHSPRFSPDGKSLAFVRGGTELRVIDIASGRERMLATGALERPPLTSDRSIAWSPDGEWIAYSAAGERLFRNLHVVPAAGGQSRPVSFLANSSTGNTISWSPDGTFLLFESGQRTERFQLARVDLVPRTPRFREDQFRDLFQQENPRNPAPPADSAARSRPDSAAAPARGRRIVFDEIRRRLSLLPVAVDVGYQAISPDGKQVLLIAGAAGQQNLYLFPLDELAREEPVVRQLTSTPGAKGDAYWSPDGKEIFYLDAGRIQSLTVESRAVRPIPVSAEMEVDFAREKVAVFEQAWSYLRDHFYDERFHGADWRAVHGRYAPHVAGARTPDELRRVLQLMAGELNASHLGVNPPGGSSTPSTGRLGLSWDAAEYERSGRLRVAEVLPLGPADVAGGIRPGDYLVRVEGTPVTPRTNLDQLLAFRIGRRTVLRVASAGGAERDIVVRPVNAATEKGLLYRDWVEGNRRYVERASGGRLGYVHMFDMSEGSLSQLYVDLDAENHAREGVVIDLRNNNGGFVNVYATDVFARRPYLTMQPRGMRAAPARGQLGQRALERPTVLVVNRHSLSDAEDFTEGYRTLGLGQVVGEPTAGWIVFTWNVPLVDGSIVRLPRSRITDTRGQNMELNPRPVDVRSQRPIGESYLNRDTQLDAAVSTLLKK
ncbi:MAG: tolB protein precursor, periplasmic protein involved in the tonb-independent uptake of group A colicins [uncultured Gemmatimonadetes bacterium]|uniref:Tricorn protease homolog n=1 Tax=uncultured Gemmatimonadota bacterium TaxID=203437 RepID=A0A6J4KNR2_9BACT|nr:MAG: tolB protein precursor, periplasmic protein involved in the tonb-independent uptake of group A colicins [uncultured Gemmatimonadota bacterium]